MASKRQRLGKDPLDHGNAMGNPSQIYRNAIAIRPLVMPDEDPVMKALTDMVLLHKYPLSIVDHVGFQDYSRNLNPHSKMVSRKQLKESILKAYSDESQKKRKTLNDQMCRIAVSMELWTSHDERRQFVASTAHYIDDSWKLQNFLFEFTQLSLDCSERLRMENYVECLCGWKLDQKLSTLTFDDCFKDNFIKETYSSRFDCEKLILGGKFVRMKCFSHTLRSLVAEALAIHEDATAKVLDSVVYWTAAHARKLKFHDLARQLGIPCRKKLFVCHEKEWDLVYLMLERALEFRDVFKNEKLSEPGYTCIPTEEDWKLTKEICGPLKLFYDSGICFFRKKFYTANDYFPKVCDIKLALSQWLTSEVEGVRSMASSMVENFDEYWNEVNTMLAVAAVLDPRYKMHLVEYYFTKIYKDEAQGEINKVTKICNELFKEYRTKARLSKTSNHINRQKKKDPMCAFDLFVTERKKESVTTELDYFLDDELVPRNANFDVLSWWHANGVKYPTLKTIARDVLAIPVSKVAPSAMFSIYDNVLEQNFDKLSVGTITAIMCKRNWLAAEFPDSTSVHEEGEDSAYESP